jgi:hypothetical protein
VCSTSSQRGCGSSYQVSGSGKIEASEAYELGRSHLSATYFDNYPAP